MVPDSAVCTDVEASALMLHSDMIVSPLVNGCHCFQSPDNILLCCSPELCTSGSVSLYDHMLLSTVSLFFVSFLF